jgi:hypothetical protein
MRQLCNQTLDTAANRVPDATDRVKVLAGGIVQVPVEIALARAYGAHVAAAHRDEHV